MLNEIYSSLELRSIKKDQKRRIKEAHARIDDKPTLGQKVLWTLIIATPLVLLAILLQDIITHWPEVTKYNLL